jgi:hypothetical protein
LADIVILSSRQNSLKLAEQCLQHLGKSTLPIVNNKGEPPSQPGEYRIHKGEITQRGIGQSSQWDLLGNDGPSIQIDHATS